jgi:hypothetical protein
VYEQHFQQWFAAAVEQARQAAANGFAPIAIDFTKGRQRELETERARQDDWLRQRASEILPAILAPAAEQLSLFNLIESDTTTVRALAPWRSLADPAERIAAFHGDATQPARLRSEADGVLRIYRQRLADLDARLNLREPEVVPLGVLMILPEVSSR